MVLNEQYTEAIKELSELDVDDSESVLAYAEIQDKIDSYSGSPDLMMEDINNIEGIENEKIIKHRDQTIEVLKEADNIQITINVIDITGINTSQKKHFQNILEQLNGLPDRYLTLINTTTLDQALSVLDHLEKGDSVGQVYSQINEIGEITLDSENVITSARAAYDKLSDSDKSEVLNYSTLSSAEAGLETLKEKKAEKEADERKQADEDAIKDNYTVYITTGDRYHFDGCRHLGSNKRAVTQGWAIAHDYYPCLDCISGHDVPSYFYQH